VKANAYSKFNFSPTVQFCKNIVLAGVGSLSLMDDHIVTEDDLNSNFLIPHDESIYGGRSRAEVCCQSLKDFNPMVRVDVAKGQVYSLVQFLLVWVLD
jgi:ubiquitin-like 1-activating enzyme E1 A